MPHDSNGRRLKEGDRVLVTATVRKITSDSPDVCNVHIVGPTGDIIAYDSKLVELHPDHIDSRWHRFGCSPLNLKDGSIYDESLGNYHLGVTEDFTLRWTPLRPGTLKLTIGDNITVDDAQGSLVALNGIAGTIDYASGKLHVAYAPVKANTPIFATYHFNAEEALKT